MTVEILRDPVVLNYRSSQASRGFRGFRGFRFMHVLIAPFAVEGVGDPTSSYQSAPTRD